MSNCDESDEPLTLHDCLAAPVDDPATSAARRLDWAMVLSVLDPVATAILLALLEGTALALLVPRLKRGRTSLHNDQKRLGAHVRCEGKGRRERCTPLAKPTVAVLKAWIKEQGVTNRAFSSRVAEVGGSALTPCNMRLPNTSP